MLEQPFVIYWPDGTSRKDTCQLPDPLAPNFLTRLKAVVEPFTGDPLEHVNVFWDYDGDGRHDYIDMFVNEHGHALDLPLNRAATRIYQHNVIYHEPATASATLPVVVGTAVLFRNKIWK